MRLRGARPRRPESERGAEVRPRTSISRLIVVKPVLLLLLLSGASASGAQGTMSDLELFPLPKRVERSSGALVLSSGIVVSVDQACGDRLEAAVERLESRLEARTGFPRILGAVSSTALAVELHCQNSSSELGLDPGHESYRLSVDASGIEVSAPRPEGVMRGLETLVQLVGRDRQGFALPFVVIEDEPRFAWRGLLLDPSSPWWNSRGTERGPITIERGRYLMRTVDGSVSGIRCRSRLRIQGPQTPAPKGFGRRGPICGTAHAQRWTLHRLRARRTTSGPTALRTQPTGVPPRAAGRHWLPVEAIRRTLDAMAAVKLNVLHWHLTDDQGFRIESRRYPALHERGSDGQYYTQEEVRELIAHAQGRGIRVVPEFDVPGHTGSWLVGHPELAAMPGPHPQIREYGIQDTVMNPTSDRVFELLGGFFDEMAELFPDPVVHIGGDEVNGVWWQSSASIQTYMKEHGLADQHALQNAFNHRLTRLLRKNRKRMMGWAEIQAAGLPGDPIIHVWNDTETLAAAVENGYDAVFSFGYYLDLMFPASAYYAIDPVAFDPSHWAERSEQSGRILGGEACLWGELVSAETLDAQLWPAAAAVAERLWSEAVQLDPETLYPRLERLLDEPSLLGVDPESDLRRLRARLVGSSDRSAATLEALELFASVLQSPRFYLRHRLRAATQLTPLNTLADALAPESSRVRDMHGMIDRGELAELARQLSGLARLDRDLARVFSKTEVERPIVDAVVWLSGAGLRAIEHLEAGTEFEREEGERLLRRIEVLPGPEETIVAASLEGKRSSAEMRAQFALRQGQAAIDIALVSPIRRLVEMASPVASSTERSDGRP